MPAFAGPSRPDPAATSAAWVEVTLPPSDRVERLGSLQPEAGLLWVARGQVTVHSSKRSEILQKGSVVAYRIGGSLGWSAREGALVRWCARDVRVEPGEARRWTEDLALQLPALKSAPHRQGKGPAALLVLAFVAVGALGAAWAHSKGAATPAHLGVVAPAVASSGVASPAVVSPEVASAGAAPSPGSPAAGTSAAIATPSAPLPTSSSAVRLRQEEVGRIGMRALEDAGLLAQSPIVPPSGAVFTCRVPYPPGSPDLAAALLASAAERIYGEAPWVRRVRVIFEGPDEGRTFAILVLPTGESAPD